MEFKTVDEILALAQRGDILKFERDLFCHFALYLGDSLVMDIYTGGGSKSLGASRAQIRRSTLRDVCGSSRVRINNLENEALARFNVGRLPVDQIISNAERDEQRGNVKNGILGSNFEFYCTSWLYGRVFSLQVNNLLFIILNKEERIHQVFSIFSYIQG